MRHPNRALAALALSILASLAATSAAQSSPAAPTAPADKGWPRVFTNGDQKVVLYQPQIDSWPDYQQVNFRMAVAVTPSGGGEPGYGIVEVQAATSVDYGTRTVMVESPQSIVRFPNLPPDKAAQLETQLRQVVPQKASIAVSLDRMLACMQSSATPAAGGTVSVKLDPPTIDYSTGPAILLQFMGPPRVKPIQGTLLLGAINANWDVFLDEASGSYYLLDGSHGNTWLTASDPVAGPWTTAAALPDSFKALPATDQWKDVRAAIPAPGSPLPGTPVKVFTSTKPAELIVVQGEPSLEPISGTQLLAVANTDSVLFQHMGDGTWYYLVAGRWFSAASPLGPWAVATNSLPPDFAKIPPDDPHAFVLDSVPGTQAASDAVLLAKVPRTAIVPKSSVSLTVTYNGTPKFVSIPPTAMTYAANTPMSVIDVDGTYFCCHQAVWFTATDPNGPWSVAASVPAAIYTIPPTSPMYPVTFVKVYSATPDSVTVGYTSGYDGEYVAQTGTLMYGLGYAAGQQAADDSNADNDTEDDEEYWDGYYHYGPAYCSYGYGTVYGGYANGCYYRGGAAYGPYCGAARATAYNPVTGAWASTGYHYTPYGAAGYHAGFNPATDTGAAHAGGVNAYSSWGRSVVTHGDQWATAGHTTTAAGTAGWAQTSSGAEAAGVKTANNGAFVAKGPEGDVYAGADGNVYKKNDDGSWSQHDGNNWAQPAWGAQAAQPRPDNDVGSRGGGAQPSPGNAAGGQGFQQSLESQASARQWGGFRAGGGGGGFRGGRR